MTAVSVFRSSSVGLFVLFIVWAVGMAITRPFWIAATDVEIDFVFRGLSLARGVFQPHGFGAILDGIAGMVAWGIGSSLDHIQTIVVILRLLGLSATVGASILLIRSVFSPLPRMLQAVIILSFFFNPSARLYLSYWSAEQFVFVAGALAIVFYWRSLDPFRWGRYGPLFIAGSFMGLAISVKPYFIALLMGCVVGYMVRWWGDSGKDVVRQWGTFFRSLVVYGLGVGMGGLVGFAVFVNDPRYVVGFLAGRAASGSPFEFLQFNSVVALDAVPFTIFYLIIVWIIMGATFIPVLLQKRYYNRETILILTMIVSMVIGVMIALLQPAAGTFSQHPAVAARFLLPVSLYGMFGFGFLLIIWNERREIILRTQHIFLTIALILVGVQTQQDVSLLQKRDQESNQTQASLIQAIFRVSRQMGYEPVVLFYGAVVDPVSTLWAGDQYTQKMFDEEIRSRYPWAFYQNFSLPLHTVQWKPYDVVILPIRELPSNDLAGALGMGFRGEAIKNAIVLTRRDDE